MTTSAAEPEVVRVPLPYGLTAVYVMRAKPTPPAPAPYEQAALDVVDKPEAGAPCPF